MFETFDNRNNAPAVPTGNPVDPALDLSRRWRQKSDEWDAAQAALAAIVDGLPQELKAATAEWVWLRDAAGRKRTAYLPGR
jgi:hypothetical protein